MIASMAERHIRRDHHSLQKFTEFRCARRPRRVSSGWEGFETVTFVLATNAVPIVIDGLMPYLHGFRVRLLRTAARAKRCAKAPPIARHVAVADGPHGRHQAGLLGPLGERPGSKLHPVVGVDERGAGGGVAVLE